jgi:hypothetical protein
MHSCYKLYLILFSVLKMIYCTLLHWDVVVLLSESPAIINDLDVIVHGFMLQIIYTTLHIRLVNRLKFNFYNNNNLMIPQF